MVQEVHTLDLLLHVSNHVNTLDFQLKDFLNIELFIESMRFQIRENSYKSNQSINQGTHETIL